MLKTLTKSSHSTNIEMITNQGKIVIELNDKSHDTEHRRTRDAFMAEAFKGAGIPLHFVRAAARYDAESLKALLPHPQAQSQRQQAMAARKPPAPG